MYEIIERESVLGWIIGKQKGIPGSIWELETPAQSFERVLHSQVASLRQFMSFQPDSGAVEFDFDRFRDVTNTQMTVLSLTIAAEFDRRDFFRWEELDEEEQGAPLGFDRAVTDEHWGSIDGVQPVGPGGRVTIYGTQRRSEIVVRHRVRSLGGRWRAPSTIQEVVNDMVGEDPGSGIRLRGTLGYFEASKVERQQYLRPAFLFVLDRPLTGDGPRWRVATVTAATTNDDLPPIAGLESAAAGCP